MTGYHKLPRIYTNKSFEFGKLNLERDQAHYLGTVLRKTKGDKIRIFNGADGEWLAGIDRISKKECVLNLEQQTRKQAPEKHALHLLFAPVKRVRLDWLIEKSVELGATHLHPVLTSNTEVRSLKTEKIKKQIIEAAEQCERLSLPELNPVQPLVPALGQWPEDIPLYICLERSDAAHISKSLDPLEKAAFLIGPEGGFTKEERAFLSDFRTVSLGPSLMKTETAAVFCLSAFALINRQD